MNTFSEWIFKPNADMQKTVISTFSGDYTLQDIKKETENIKSLLIPLGRLEGKKVGVLIPYIHKYVPLVLAINELGGTVSPLAWQLRKKDLNSILDILDPHIVFTIDEYNGFSFKDAIYSWAEKHEKKNYLYILDKGLNLQLQVTSGEEKPTETNLPKIISSTSGSTGVPKGIMADSNLIKFQSYTHTVALDFEQKDHLFLISPTSSHYGLVLLLIGLDLQYHMVIAESFDFPRMVHLLKDRPCNKALTTPSLFRSFYMIAKQMAPEVLDQFEIVDVTGESISKDFVSAVYDLKGKLMSTYGLSEQGSLLYTKKDIRNGVLYSVTPGILFKIIDQNEEGVGEVLFKHENDFKGYYKRPDLTKMVYTDDGWFKTGDLAYLTVGNEIKIVGRKKEMIKKGGQQVIPGEIEHLLTLHENVDQAIVVGVPHKAYGEQIVAFVILNNNMNVDSLYGYLSEIVARYKVPDHIFKIDKIPSNNGKQDKKTLYNKAVKELGIDLEEFEL